MAPRGSAVPEYLKVMKTTWKGMEVISLERSSYAVKHATRAKR